MDGSNLAQRRAWVFTILAVLIGALLFLKPFLSIIALAALFAYLFDPMYKSFLRRFKDKKSPAIAVTTVLSLLIIGIPILLILAISVAQAIKLADSLGIQNLAYGGSSLSTTVTNIVNSVNAAIESMIGVEQAFNASSITGFIKEIGPKLANAFVELVSGLITSVPAFFTNLITYVFVFVGILLGQDKLLEAIRYLSPFNDKVNGHYFHRIGLMCKSMVKGQLFIASIQGTASALAVAFALNLWEYFFFFLILFIFMSLIPLGAGIITIPLGIVNVLIGNYWQGLLILANHFLIVTNVDNIRPRLVPKEARLPAALTILAAFAGVKYFGLVGVVYGPIIMIFITTTIEMYVEYRKGLQTKPKTARTSR